MAAGSAKRGTWHAVDKRMKEGLLDTPLTKIYRLPTDNRQEPAHGPQVRRVSRSLALGSKSFPYRHLSPVPENP